jgi:transcriptional regulator GlxA family with amidase domain
MAYLRRVRMDRVHTDLLAADPSDTTVTAIAARWGFLSAGRFSADYRSTYAELPRQTLRRR